MMTSLGSQSWFAKKMAEWDALDPNERREREIRLERSKKEEEAKHLKQLEKNARRGFTSLDELDWEKTFDSLTIIDQNRTVIGRLKRWTPEMKRGIVLNGPVGTGKSHLCKCIINRWASPKYRCQFIEMGQAMERLRGAIDARNTSVDYECQKLIAPNLLVFDDLGAEKSTEWAREKIFSIFEARARQGKHTFFTTNLTPEQIEETYKSRIHDRMVEFCSWVTVDGQSFRKLSFKNEI